MSKFKSGDKVKVVSGLPEYWYCNQLGKEFIIDKYWGATHNGRDVYYTVLGNVVVICERDLELVEAAAEVPDVRLNLRAYVGEVEDGLNNETPSKLNVNEAVELLQGLLEDIYSTDVEIVLKHDSVRVNAFGKTFLTGSEDSLEDICKAITVLSGARLGD